LLIPLNERGFTEVIPVPDKRRAIDLFADARDATLEEKLSMLREGGLKSIAAYVSLPIGIENDIDEDSLLYHSTGYTKPNLLTEKVCIILSKYAKENAQRDSLED